MSRLLLPFLISMVIFFGCNQNPSNSEIQSPNMVIKEKYGTLPEGGNIDLYTLTNANGMEVKITNYGGIITHLKAPDRDNNHSDVVLGYDSLQSYIANNPYFGALIGRYGNRIANGKFIIDEKEYQLAQNNGPNHLHGGIKGFDKADWEVIEINKNADSASIRMNYFSTDMEEGYPGNLDVFVTYSLNSNNELKVHYQATTDKATIVNLTQHSYFNLSGNFSNEILDHEIVINADAYLPVDSTLIPTGEIRNVTGTPFDFTSAKAIGKDINADDNQLKVGNGYDHCWVLNDQNSGMRLIASAYHPGTGRFLEIISDEPAVQFYTGNFLDGTLSAKGGGTYPFRSGFCLETQHYPDSPNQPEFPSVLLNPGEKYETTTIFRFSAK